MTIQEVMKSTGQDGSKLLRLRYVGSAHNPCFKHTPDIIVPDIDWDITVDISVQADGESGLVTATGKVDGFPAFEMYVSQGTEPGRPLFRIPPPVGNTPRDLQGPARFDIPQPSTVTLDAGIDGKWESTDADKRFLLDINGSTVIWTERGTANTSPGQILRRTVSSSSLGGRFRIERANDMEALVFANFQPQSLRDAILARSPQPSFIVFTRNGGTITAEFNGLRVTKNPNGTLNQIIQPGVRPPTIFTLKRVS